VLDVLNNRLAHHSRKRIYCEVIGLAFAHMQPIVSPIDIVEGETCDFTSAQSIDNH
jgi:hypothetical protein